MTESFDLTSRPWLPCERPDGTILELSTRDALAEAHKLRGLANPSPLMLAVLHRHLLAVLHRVYQGPRTFKEWEAIARAGSFDVLRVDAYLTCVRDRMDLFHPTHPFAQTRGLKEQFEATPIDRLATERAGWGNARSLFLHPNDAKGSLEPAEAARALLVCQSFDMAGLVRKPNEPTAASGAPLIRAATVLLRGESLFLSLVANLLCYDPIGGLPIPGSVADAPSWEQVPPPRQLRQPKEPTFMPNGWLDLLTWLSRRIELIVDGDRVVSFVRAVGKGLVPEAPLEPMFSYQRKEKLGFVGVEVNESKAFWRDAHVFFEALGEGKAVRPKALEQVAQIDVEELLGTGPFSIEIYGVSSDSGKSPLGMLRAERLVAALSSLNDPAAGDVVRRALYAAEEGVKVLLGSLRTYARHQLSEGSRQPETKDVSALVKSFNAEPSVWSTLGVHFLQLVADLKIQPEDALTAFLDTSRASLLGAFKEATSQADSTARSLKARALAERTLRIELSRIFPRPNAIQEDPLAAH